MKKVLIISAIIGIILFGSCIRKSYCFLNPQQNKIFLTDTNKISSLTVLKNGDFKNSIKISFDSTITEINLPLNINRNEKIVFLVKTSNYNYYELVMDSADWYKSGSIRFRKQIR